MVNPPHPGGSSFKMWIIYIIIAVVGSILLLVIAYCIYQKRKKAKLDMSQ